MIVQLLAGMFLGSALASAVWGFILKTQKSRSEALRRERDEVMHSIGEIWVDIDSLLSSYRCGVVDDKGFHETFTVKIDSINQLLKPNMHLFEVYYVKYIEGQIEHYKRTAHYTGTVQPITAGTAADHELETSYAMVSHHDAPDQKSVTPPAETEAAQQSDTIDGTLTHGEEEESDAVSEDEAVVDEEAAEAAESVDDAQVATPEVAVTASEEDTTAASDPLPEHTENESEEAPVDTTSEEAPPEVVEPEADSVEAAPEEQAVEDDGVFDVVIAEDKEPEEDFLLTKGSVSEGAPETAADSEVKPGPVAAETGDVESEFFGEEDFTMETLMDVDINSISPYIEAAEKEKAKESAPEEKSDLDVVIAEGVSHTDTVSEAPQDVEEDPAGKKDQPLASALDNDDIPEETTYTPATELEKRTHAAADDAEEQFADIEDFEVTIADETGGKAKDVAPVDAEEAEQEEMTFFDSELVTGDDVADTIAALESKPASEPAPSSEKKSEEKPVQEKKKSKKKNKKSDKEPVAVTAEKKTTGEKKKDGEESITGDDVVDQIDSFFGLIE